jgi:hypothetical protein
VFDILHAASANGRADNQAFLGQPMNSAMPTPKSNFPDGTGPVF